MVHTSQPSTVKLLFKVLNVARSMYYNILNQKSSMREIENNTLKKNIQSLL